MADRYNLSPETAEGVKRLLRDEAHRINSDAGARNRRNPSRDTPARYQAQCTVAIPEGTDLDTPGEGEAKLLRKEDGTDSLEAFSPTRTVDVYNYSSTAIAVDDYLKVELIDGQWQPYGMGGSPGTKWVEGIVVDNSCPEGTLDIQVKGASAKGVASLNDEINCVDWFGIMDGHTAAELAVGGVKALAGRTWRYDTEAWEWRLWLIGGVNECND